MLVHLVDVSEMSGREPVDDFNIVMNELESFSEDLIAKPMVIVATKIDIAQDDKRVKSLERLAKRKKMPFFKISAVTGDGIEKLKRAMANAVLAVEVAS